MNTDMDIDREERTGRPSLLDRLGPSEPSAPATIGTDKDRLNRLLDTPLGVDPDEYNPGQDGEAMGVDTEEKLDSALDKGLKDRLSKSRLYLLEESGTIIHHPDIEDREVRSSVIIEVQACLAESFISQEEEPDFSYLGIATWLT
jgi:hypothetical protein